MDSSKIEVLSDGLLEDVSGGEFGKTGNVQDANRGKINSIKRN